MLYINKKTHKYIQIPVNGISFIGCGKICKLIRGKHPNVYVEITR